jgi:hypothetical protein
MTYLLAISKGEMEREQRTFEITMAENKFDGRH